METLEYYKSIFKLGSSPCLLIEYHDSNFYITLANIAFHTQFGFSELDLNGKLVSTIFGGEEDLSNADFKSPRVLNSLKLVLETKKSHKITDFYWEPNHKSQKLPIKYLTIENIPIPSSSGEVVYILLSIIDVTDSVLATKNLNEEENKFQFVIDNTSDAVIIFGADHHIKYASSSYFGLLGYSELEDIGRSPDSIYSLIHPDEREYLFSSIFNAIENKKDTLLYSYRVLNKAGTYLWREDHAKFRYDKNGIYLGCIVICRDITERKRIESDLKEAKEKYRGLSEASFESIFISEKGVCIEQNLAAEKMFGYTNEEAIGRMGTDWIVPEDREFVIKNMISGFEEPYEAKALRKDGSTFPCILLGKMMNYKGKTVRVTSLTDISIRKNAEIELEKQNMRLREIAWVQSHIVRAPLARMMGLIELIEIDNQTNDETKQLLKYVLSSANEFDTIIKKIIDNSNEISDQNSNLTID